MKKTLLIASIALFWGSVLSAQVVPNGGFEVWTSHGSGTFELPDFWNTTDSISLAYTGGFSHSAIKETTDLHGGSFALRLTGWQSPLGPAPGAATNGEINTSNFTIIGGTPDTVRHAKLNGFYRFTPAGTDICSVIVSLLRWNSSTNMRDTIAGGEFSANSTTGGAAYAPFTVNLSYQDWINNPDTMVILITTAPLQIGSGTVGTTLLIDDLSFTGVVGINELESVVRKAEVFPSPASSFITIRVELKRAIPLHYSIYDVRGKQVFSDVLEPYETRVNVSYLPAGNYKLQLMEGAKTAYSTGFVINR